MTTNYDSNEELYFSWYINELHEAGFIESIEYHPKAFSLFAKQSRSYDKQLKTKIISVQESLFNAHEYQADFLIWWNKDIAKDIFITNINSNERLFGKDPKIFITNTSKNTGKEYSIIDVKGNYNQNDAYRRFSIDQKWVYANYNLYVQKIIPAPGLFQRTFTPDRYCKCDNKILQDRKINFTVRSLKMYLAKFQPES